MKKINRKKFFSLLAASAFSLNLAFAQGGMWTPNLLPTQAEKMKQMGMTIPISKLYGETGNSLNNAIALFGGGCSSEMVSNQGLLLTNHHCAYGAIQSLSSADRNILLEGYWAKNRSEELPVPGLSVRFVRKMTDVTREIVFGLTDTLDLAVREQRINNRIKNLEEALSKSSGLIVQIKPFYSGNQYQAIYIEKFDDVRLVGTPPNGIGKFGGDEDNWMWPRMTGDFAVLRVYADANNQPAEYSPNNKPYRPKAYFPISTRGVKEGDFTMVYGFPFQTQQYISSHQLKIIEEHIDPIRISSRHVRLGVLEEEMRKDPEVFIKYASKQSSVSNGYKKWQGEIQGLAINKVYQKKLEQERDFSRWVSRHENEEYKLLLTRMAGQANAATPFIIQDEYLKETILGIEIINRGQWLYSLVEEYAKASGNLAEKKETILKVAENFYKDYDARVDKKVFVALTDFYFNKIDLKPVPALERFKYQSGNDLGIVANYVFSGSALKSEASLKALFEKNDEAMMAAIKEDPAYMMYKAVKDYQNDEVKPVLDRYRLQMGRLNRLYMKAQMEYNPQDKIFFPDANQTMRITYGQVTPIDLGTSNYAVSTLEHMMPRHDANMEDFNIPMKMRTLHQNEDYGRWKRNGTVPVNFIATNHTSGGNSGSPVLNGRGELIGINFDRIWQGTMSDLYFDPNLSRNISVDILYVLFVIEKYGDAGWILKEMDLRR